MPLDEQLEILLGETLMPEVMHSMQNMNLLNRLSRRRESLGLQAPVRISGDDQLDARVCEIRYGNRVLAQKTIEDRAGEELIVLLDLALSHLE